VLGLSVGASKYPQCLDDVKPADVYVGHVSGADLTGAESRLVPARTRFAVDTDEAWGHSDGAFANPLWGALGIPWRVLKSE